MKKQKIMKTIALPEWAYDRLAEQIAETDVDLADYKWSGRAEFYAGLLFNDDAGKQVELEMKGDLAVNEEDMSFTHDFGTEVILEAHPAGIDYISRVEAWDEDDIKCDIIIDYGLLNKKVERLCR